MLCWFSILKELPPSGRCPVSAEDRPSLFDILLTWTFVKAWCATYMILVVMQILAHALTHLRGMPHHAFMGYHMKPSAADAWQALTDEHSQELGH